MFRAILAAAAVAAFARAEGAKRIGYVGANSGGRTDALKIVAVDAETGAAGALGPVGVADATYAALNKSRTRLYVTCSDPAFGPKGADGGLAVFAVDPTGTKLDRLDGVGTKRGAPCHVSLSPDGKRAVFAEYSRGTAGWVDLKADGTFDKATLKVVESTDPTGPDRKRQDRPHCHCAVVTPDGKYTCIVDLGTDRVKIFAKSGEFVRDLLMAPAGGGPRHLVFHPNGKFAYVVTEMMNLVTAFAYSDGEFRFIRQLPLLPEGFKGFSKAAAIKFTPDGKRLACSNRGHNSLAFFDVDAETGDLKARAIVPLGADFPWDFDFLPGGKIVAVGLMKDRSLRTYRYDAEKCTLEPVAEVRGMGSVFCTAGFGR